MSRPTPDRHGGFRQAGALAWRDLHRDAVGDGGGELGLQDQQIAELPMVLFSPDVLSGAGVHETSTDADPIADALNRAFDDAGDAELAGEFLERPFGALIPHD